MSLEGHENDQVCERNARGRIETGSSGAENDQVNSLWQRSSERRAIRRIGYICLAAVLLPSLIALGILLYKQTAYFGAVNAATSAADQALTNLEEKQNAEKTARDDLGSALADLEVSQGLSEPNDAQQTAVKSSQNDVNAAVAASKIAQDRLDTAERTVADVKKSFNLMGAWLSYSILFVAAIVAAALFYQYFKAEKIRSFENSRIIEDLRSKEMEGDPEDPLDFIVLWKNNRDQLSEYHKLILNYASSTRQTTIITLLAGFSFLLIVSVIALFAHSVPSSIAASVVAAAGAAVTGFIGNAVLHNADTSSREVLAFFAHPLVVERMLSAERLIREMPESSRQAARLLVVQSLTRTPASKDVPGTELLASETETGSNDLSSA
jgi:hypothetical protein